MNCAIDSDEIIVFSDIGKKIVQDILYYLNIGDDLINLDVINVSMIPLTNLDDEEKQLLIDCCKKWKQIISCAEIEKRIFLLSVMVALECNKTYLIEMLNEVNNTSALTAEQLYFVNQQVSSLTFRYPQYDCDEILYLLGELQKKVVSSFVEKIPKELLKPIPLQERNDKLIYVITDQFIGINHGPTKSALDRCHCLITKLNLKVLLINSAETLSMVGFIPFYDFQCGIYLEELSSREFVEWMDCKIPFFQCDRNMPNFNVIEMLLQNIQNVKPSMILEIGGKGILASLASNIVPVLTNGMCTSSLVGLCTTAQTYGLPLSISDKHLLGIMGKDEDAVIHDTFTWKLQNKKRTYSREEIGLPYDKFCVAIIGARLDSDLNEEFLIFLEQIARDDYLYVLMGICNDYEKIISNHPKLNGKICNLKFVDDVQGYVEQCDLYLNPPRRGGGFSAVEAMMQGIPVISFAWGDVAVASSEEFWACSYEEVQSLIERYRTDEAFYNIKSSIARNRAVYLQESETMFVETIMEFKRRFCM